MVAFSILRASINAMISRATTDYCPCGPFPGVAELVESEGRREVPLSVDLRLQIGDLLLRGGNGIGAGDKAARRRLLAGGQNSRWYQAAARQKAGRIIAAGPVTSATCVPVFVTRES
jgi:hypothetical protein